MIRTAQMYCLSDGVGDKEKKRRRGTEIDEKRFLTLRRCELIFYASPNLGKKADRIATALLP